MRGLLEDRRLQRLDNECEQRQRAKLKAVSEERKRRIQQEEQRRAALRESADDWQQARGLRAYLRALQSKIARGDVAPADPEKFAEWFDWASWYADSIDPLPSSLLPTCAWVRNNRHESAFCLPQGVANAGNRTVGLA